MHKLVCVIGCLREWMRLTVCVREREMVRVCHMFICVRICECVYVYVCGYMRVCVWECICLKDKNYVEVCARFTEYVTVLCLHVCVFPRECVRVCLLMHVRKQDTMCVRMPTCFTECVTIFVCMCMCAWWGDDKERKKVREIKRERGGDRNVKRAKVTKENCCHPLCAPPVWFLPTSLCLVIVDCFPKKTPTNTRPNAHCNLFSLITFALLLACDRKQNKSQNRSEKSKTIR